MDYLFTLADSSDDYLPTHTIQKKKKKKSQDTPPLGTTQLIDYFVLGLSHRESHQTAVVY